MLTWILVSFGITVSITNGKLFKNFRKKATNLHPLLGDLVSCPMCLGFWTGLFLSITWKSITGNLILDGFFSVATCWIIHCITWALALHDERV